MNPVVVINSGRPGDTTVQLLERFEARIAGFQPDLVLYWIGSNDMLYPGHTVEPPQFRANCRELAARARSIGAAVAFLTLPPLITAYLLEQFPGVADYPESATERRAIGNRLLAA
ncbi:MAG: GDSL-type esterase/lipase family protein, partial [Victivallaceae bacterium]|nr:GDSL-type esterase/lipase family protein [Victivallaceae bacterium]